MSFPLFLGARAVANVAVEKDGTECVDKTNQTRQLQDTGSGSSCPYRRFGQIVKLTFSGNVQGLLAPPYCAIVLKYWQGNNDVSNGIDVLDEPIYQGMAENWRHSFKFSLASTITSDPSDMLMFKRLGLGDMTTEAGRRGAPCWV